MFSNVAGVYIVLSREVGEQHRIVICDDERINIPQNMYLLAKASPVHRIAAS